MNKLRDMIKHLPSWRRPACRKYATVGRGNWAQCQSALGLVRVHGTFVHCLFAICILFLVAGFSRPGWSEFISVAVTLPIIWVCSVVVRVAAQQLGLGGYAADTICVLGPTGNVSLDYEYLPQSRLLAYALVGQMATLLLAALGWVVAQATTADQVTSLALGGLQLVDFRGGWSNHALGTQLFWVNAFLGVLHLLPTVPFDTRAVLYGLLRGPRSAPIEPYVLRNLSNFVSHLAAVSFGIGIVLLMFSFRSDLGYPWYACWGCAIYLFVGARWEASRAGELEQQYAPVQPSQAGRKPKTRAKTAPAARSQPLRPPGPTAAEVVARQAAVALEEFMPTPQLDVDEILRKLHREGPQSLSPDEHQTLLSASEKLKSQREA